MKKTNQFYMAGTEGTGQYHVLAITSRGRVGVRTLDDGFSRIRIEPPQGKPKVLATMANTLSTEKGWKQPGQEEQFRFSTVVENGDLKDRLTEALSALRVGQINTTVNPELPEGTKDLIPVSYHTIFKHP